LVIGREPTGRIDADFVDLWQEGQDIMVKKHETNRKGQDVFGEFEESDGIEGPVGGAET